MDLLGIIEKILENGEFKSEIEILPNERKRRRYLDEFVKKHFPEYDILYLNIAFGIQHLKEIDMGFCEFLEHKYYLEDPKGGEVGDAKCLIRGKACSFHNDYRYECPTRENKVHKILEAFTKSSDNYSPSFKNHY